MYQVSQNEQTNIVTVFNAMRLITLILSVLVFCSFKPTETQPALIITFDNLKDTTHNIFVAISTESDKFPDDRFIVKKFIVSPEGKSRASISVADLPYGKYAVMVFQDVNGNKKMDTGFMGIPTEPFAFSNNFHPSFRSPKWKDCEFDYSPQHSTVPINGMIKML